MKYIIKHSFIFVLASILFATKVNANETLVELPLPLKVAFQQAEAAALRNKDTRFAFGFERLLDDKIVTKIYFDPALLKGDQLQVFAPTEQDNPQRYAKYMKVNQSDPIQMDQIKVKQSLQTLQALRKQIGGPIVQSQLETDNLVFSFPLAGEYKLSGGGLKADVAKYMTGEIEVDESSGNIVRTRIFAAKSFKPMAMAKIRQYNTENTYLVPWPDGPLLETRQDFQVKAKALLVRFNVNQTDRRFDFEKR